MSEGGCTRVWWHTMQYRLVLHMPVVLSVEGVPTFTCWGFLPVLLLCT